MEHLIGKYAYKKRGFFAGMVGRIERSGSELVPYKLVFKNWSATYFSSENDIILYEGEVNED